MDYFIMLFLAFLGGISFAIQGPVNAAMGKRTNSFFALFVSFGGGTVILSVLTICFGQGDLRGIVNMNPLLLFFGICGLFGVVTSIIIMPKVGAALTFITNMFGQILMGVIVDLFGLAGNTATPVSAGRLISLLFLAVGTVFIYIGSRAEETAGSRIGAGKLVMLAINFLGGMTAAIQPSFGAIVIDTVGNMEANLINFAGATVLILVFWFISAVFFGKRFLPREHTGIKPWMWCGGVLGVIGIYMSLFSIRTIGTLTQVAAILTAQMLCGIIFDANGAFGGARLPISNQRKIGLVLITIGIVFLTAEKF